MNKEPDIEQAACIAALENEVRLEFEASLQYILMAAHFSQVSGGVVVVEDKLVILGHSQPS